MTDDPAQLRDTIEERAALIQDGEGCSRAQAEDRAARLHGFSSWADWLKRGAPMAAEQEEATK